MSKDAIVVDTDATLKGFKKKIGIPPPSIKEMDRRNKDKEKFYNEKIKVVLLDAQGKLRDGCSWKMPRSKISAKLIQELISRSPIPGKLEYVQEATSLTIVYPSDMVVKCRPEPFEYHVHLRTMKRAEDIAEDPHFAATFAAVCVCQRVEQLLHV